MRILSGVLMLVLGATAAQAQTAAPVALPRNDAAVSFGFLGGASRNRASSFGWRPSLLAGVGAGHYWTDHHKTEVEAAWLSTARLYSSEQISAGSGIGYVGSTTEFRDVKFSVGHLYQFRRNQWVQQALGVGVDVDHVRATEDRRAQSVPIYLNGRLAETVAVPARRQLIRTVELRPFVKAGFKSYFNERAYFAMECKAGLRKVLKFGLWKGGFGFDF